MVYRCALQLIAALICMHIVAIYGLTAEELAKFSNDVKFEVNGDVYEFFTSGFPPHAIDNSINPNSASVQNFTYNITVNPNNEQNAVWCSSLGPAGFATNGVAIYNALTGDTTDAVKYETFDACKGHSSPDGSYHYHQFPVCMGNISTNDFFIGVALDGNPIYGPKAADRTELLMSKDLDACHGRFVNGKYRYHITTDFPYSIGCFKAEPASRIGGEPLVGGGPGGAPGGGPGGGPPGGGPPGGGPPGGAPAGGGQMATCSNTDAGAELCDCTSGTLKHCDTLTANDKNGCDTTKSPQSTNSLQSTKAPCDPNNDTCGTTSTTASGLVLTSALVIAAAILLG